jgi:uncharacterized Zn finger protein
MSELELLPCPFCGGQAEHRKISHTEEWWVQCNECWVGTRLLDNPDLPIEKWNKRT